MVFISKFDGSQLPRSFCRKLSLPPKKGQLQVNRHGGLSEFCYFSLNPASLKKNPMGKNEKKFPEDPF
jgi:hypothetical protein